MVAGGGEQELRQGVAAAELVVCRNPDQLKQTQQRDWLRALSEQVGAHDDPDGTQWKLEVPRLVREDWVIKGYLSSMDDEAGWERDIRQYPAYRSYKAYCTEDEDSVADRTGKTVTVDGSPVNGSDWAAIKGTTIARRADMEDIIALLSNDDRTKEYDNMFDKYTFLCEGTKHYSRGDVDRN